MDFALVLNALNRDVLTQVLFHLLRRQTVAALASVQNFFKLALVLSRINHHALRARSSGRNLVDLSLHGEVLLVLVLSNFGGSLFDFLVNVALSLSVESSL